MTDDQRRMVAARIANLSPREGTAFPRPSLRFYQALQRRIGQSRHHPEGEDVGRTKTRPYKPRGWRAVALAMLVQRFSISRRRSVGMAIRREAHGHWYSTSSDSSCDR
jgi:hypothetical protein